MRAVLLFLKAPSVFLGQICSFLWLSGILEATFALSRTNNAEFGRKVSLFTVPRPIFGHLLTFHVCFEAFFTLFVASSALLVFFSTPFSILMGFHALIGSRRYQRSKKKFFFPHKSRSKL